MSPMEILRVAFEAIRATRLRSALTTLGIVIGVAAVIAMVALGSGARQAVEAQLQALGTDLLTVNPGQHWSRGVASAERAALTSDDAEALRRHGGNIAAVVPSLGSRLQVKFGNDNANLDVVATTADFPTVNRFAMTAGRFFTEGDDYARRRLAVLGAQVPEELGVEPDELMGGQVMLRGIPFEVIGILEEKGRSGREDPDESVFIPFRTGQYRIFGTDRLQGITVRVSSPDSVEAALLDIERVLRAEHRLRPDVANDFRVRDNTTFLEAQAAASQTLTYLLAGIATVSLIVGGIGIMNIMLVSVTERTREIGIRKALGATRRQVLLQFLIEALALCLLGGLVGILVGLGAANLLASLNGWSSVISPAAVVVAATFSAAVGLFFGVWPARRAARLDPIEALRHE